MCRPAAVPSHGEPPVLPGPPDVPVRPLRPRVHRVRPDDPPLPPPLPAGQERLLQTDGHVWCQLATGDGLQQVGTTEDSFSSSSSPKIYVGSNDLHLSTRLLPPLSEECHTSVLF